MECHVLRSGLEVLAETIQAVRCTALVDVFCQPSSGAVNNVFFDDFYVLEQTSTFICPVILIGDLHLHQDVVTDHNTTKFHTVIESHEQDVL